MPLRKPQISRRMEMSIDVEELQMFDGIASCANHTVNFKIGKYCVTIIKLCIVENELDLIANN